MTLMPSMSMTVENALHHALTEVFEQNLHDAQRKSTYFVHAEEQLHRARLGLQWHKVVFQGGYSSARRNSVHSVHAEE
jgi:hypothetical protein